jgi:exodeoxyribonuclease-3
MTLTLATWNINSVRLREPLVLKLMDEHRPDVICLQETKCPDGSFPTKAFAERGYKHIALNGQKGYHGVATLSRVPFEKTSKRDFCGKGDSRHVVAHLPGGVELHNFYVPAGGDEPDREVNEKFGHKLDFVTEMTEMFGKRRGKTKNKIVVVGDLNIAPREHDVWGHKQLLKVVSHTPIEVEHMDRLIKSHSFVDVMREEFPEPEKLYTWWSYRARDWRAANKGRRLDHIWVTPALKRSARNIRILTDARGWDRPSDHVPVLMDLTG